MAEKRKNEEHLSSVMYTCSWCLVQKVWVLKLVSHHFQWCQTSDGEKPGVFQSLGFGLSPGFKINYPGFSGLCGSY